jgi:hypothetical protein
VSAREENSSQFLEETDRSAHHNSNNAPILLKLKILLAAVVEI